MKQRATINRTKNGKRMGRPPKLSRPVPQSPPIDPELIDDFDIGPLPRGRPKAPIATIDIVYAHIRRRKQPESIQAYEADTGRCIRAGLKNGTLKLEELSATDKVLARRAGCELASVKRRLARIRAELGLKTKKSGIT
jgi:hypothetical protein